MITNRAVNKVHGCAYYTASSAHWPAFQQRNFLLPTQKPKLSVAQPTAAAVLPHIVAYNQVAGSPAIAECTSNAAPHMQPEGTNTKSGAPLVPYSLALGCSAHIRHPSVTEQCVYQMINTTKEPVDPYDQKRIASEWSNEMRTKGIRITMQAAITKQGRLSLRTGRTWHDHPTGPSSRTRPRQEILGAAIVGFQ